MTFKLEGSYGFGKTAAPVRPEGETTVTIVGIHERSIELIETDLKREGYEVYRVKPDELDSYVIEVVVKDMRNPDGPIHILRNIGQTT